MLVDSRFWFLNFENNFKGGSTKSLRTLGGICMKWESRQKDKKEHKNMVFNFAELYKCKCTCMAGVYVLGDKSGHKRFCCLSQYG